MKQNLTHILSILDRSGSMGKFKDDTIGGFNSFIKEQQQIEGDADITIYTFSSNSKLLFSGDIKNCPKLNESNYSTGGYTALLETISTSMYELGKKFSETPEDERPSKVLVLIMTDGRENCSKPQYNRDRIKNEIKIQQDSYSWQFVFLGANQDAFAEAENLNINKGNSINYSATSGGVANAFTAINKLSTHYRSRSVSSVSNTFFQDAQIDNSKTL